MLYDRRSSQLLRRAVKNGDVDIWDPVATTLVSRLFKSLEDHLPNKDIAMSETWQNPKTARFTEHYFEGYQQNANLDSAMVEMARFAVPFGQLGIVKRIDTFLFDAQTDPPTYPQAPWGALPDFYDVIWHIRIEPFVGTYPPRLIESPIVNQLPGQPHPDLPEIQYYWYSADSAENALGLSLIVPQSHILRVFCQLPNSSEHRISTIGRLRGYRQRTDSAPSAINAHHGVPFS